MSVRVKDFFLSVLDAEQELRVIVERRARYMELATGSAGISRPVRRVQGNHHSQVECNAIRLADLAHELESREEAYVALIRRAEALILRMDRPRYRWVLEMRYLAGMSWPDIAQRMGYTDVSSAIRVHGWALQEAEKYF